MNTPACTPYLTGTEWNVTESSHTFRASGHGKCMLTGRQFFAGYPVKRIVVDGVAGLVSCHDAAKWPIVLDGAKWRSNLCFDMSALTPLIGRSDLRNVTLINRDGVATTYQPYADGTWSKAYGKLSAKQFAAVAARSYAFVALSK